MENCTKPRAFLIKLIYLIIVIAILGMFELGARLFHRDRDVFDQILAVTKQDRDLSWVQKPALNIKFRGVEVRTNSLGFRNGEIKSPKGKNQLRIVCMGASPTFGWGVAQEDAYPGQLESILRGKAGRDIEVINAGVIGYTSHQGRILLRETVLNLSPDIVTISYMVNDADSHRFYGNSQGSDREVAAKSRARIWLENMLHESAFFVLLEKCAATLKRGLSGKTGTAGVRRVPVEDYRDNLGDMIDSAKRAGIKVVLVKMPVSLPPKTRNPELLNYAELAVEYNKAMESVGEERGVPVVDIVAAFRASRERSEEALFIDPEHDLVHPSTAGHKVIGEEIVRVLARHGIP